MKETKLGIVLLSVVASLTSPADQVNAVPVRVTIEGVVTEPLFQAEEYFSDGDAMFGEFFYESSVPIWPAQDWYFPFNTPNDGFITIGTYTAQIVGEGSLKHVQALSYVNNDATFGLFPDFFLADQFAGNPHADGSVLGTMTPDHLSFNLFDSTATVFDNISLPTALPPLSRFDIAEWVFLFQSTNPLNMTYPGYVRGEFTRFEIAVVPESSIVVLCVTTVIALAAYRSRVER